MTRSRQLDDRNIETRRALFAPRRVVACAVIALTIAAGVVVVDSLRRSVAQLGAAVSVAAQHDAATTTSAAAPPVVSSRTAPRSPPIEALPNEQAAAVESEPIDSSAENETLELQEFAAPGPLTGAGFAALVESGALGDVGVDAEAIAEMRRALDAAAFEAELEPSEP
jgi:hypothetical protein